ncbi:MAG: UMP kinase [Pseudomonadota bacterium]
MSKPKYKKILLKLSGEALLPEGSKYGISVEHAKWLVEEIKEVGQKGVSIAVVIGGGNIFRGLTAENTGMNRVRADSMGMLATVINGLALLEVFERLGVTASLLSAKEVQGTADLYNPGLARELWNKNHVLILTGGTGNPYFSTDTAASLRAAEIQAEVVFKGTKVNGVFDSDPVTNPNAKRFEFLTFDEVLSRKLKVMDSTSISMCRDNNIPIVVFNIFEKGSLLKAVMGENIGTVVYDKQST